MKTILSIATAAVVALLTACTTAPDNSCGCNHSDTQITCPKDCKCGCHDGQACSCGAKDGAGCQCAKHTEKQCGCNKK